MKVWVVVSDCGLNGPWVHGVFASEPGEEVVRQCEKEAFGVTGYQFTTVPTFDVISPVGWKGICTVTLTADHEGGFHGMVRREGTTAPFAVKSLNLRGAQREVSGWLVREGYELFDRWRGSDGLWVRKGVRT